MSNSYWKRFLFLEKKLLELSNYVDIDEKNFKTFSLEIMSLYLSTCSEIEAIYKEITDKKGKSYNFKEFRQDFLSLKNNQFLLEKISLKYSSIELTPLIDINQKKENQDDFIGIKWWQDHNSIKHDRDINFHYATLENFISSLSALYLLNLYLNFEKNELSSISPIPELFETNNFYVDMRLGGRGFEYIKFKQSCS